MPNKYTQEDFLKKAIGKHGDFYGYSKAIYISAGDVMVIDCPIHGEFQQTPRKHLFGQGCYKCGKVKAGLATRSNNKTFIERSVMIHNNKYDYSLVNYMGSTTYVQIICPKHGVFEQAPHNHLTGQGCSACKGDKTREVHTYTREQFIEKANTIYKNKYDYSQTIYIRSDTKIKIICPTHGLFTKKANNHLQGQGCKECSKEAFKLKMSSNKDNFIKKAILKHKDKYCYKKVKYIGSKKEVEIVCNKCQITFFQTPNSHLRGSNCPVCSSILAAQRTTLTTEEFITKAVSKHGNRYDYTEVDYKHNSLRVIVNCNKCKDVFTPIAHEHLRGSGCPNCLGQQRGWQHSVWEKAGKNSINFDSFKVYIIRCWNDTEEFYKIGRTFLVVKKRFPNKRSMPYQCEIVKIIEDTAKRICELEQFLHKNNRNSKYIPKLDFDGMYECFSQVTY